MHNVLPAALPFTVVPSTNFETCLHHSFLTCQVCLELAGGCAFIAAVSLGCSAHPDRCGPFSGALNFAVRHVLPAMMPGRSFAHYLALVCLFG